MTTETDLSQSLQATALAAMLEAARIPQNLVNYRGVLTPQSLDAPQAETAALVSGAAIHDLGWMRRVAVRGQDRFRWLSGMVSNTVNDLFPNSGAWNLALNAKGHIQGDLNVWRGSEELSPARRKTEAPGKKSDPAPDPLSGTPFAGESTLELEIAADQFDKLLAHFNQFIIMDEVELVPLGAEPNGEAGSETAIGLTGPLADEVFARAGLDVALTQPMSSVEVEWNGIDLRIFRNHGAITPHYEIFLPSAFIQKLWSCLATAGATRVGCAALDALRIAEAVPLYGIDIAERDLPQEISQTRALHFNKGCYMGQEIVERIRSRGGVHRHLRPLEISGPAPSAGAELKLEDGAEAGKITSAAELQLPSGSRIFALAMLRAQAEKPGLNLTWFAGAAQGTARILETPPILHIKA
jgi:folate-binding protein YgfZ